MFGKLLASVATALGVGRYRIALTRTREGVVLQAFIGAIALPLPVVAAKVTVLAPLADLPARRDGSILLPPGLLEVARQVLRAVAQDTVEVVISPEVACLRPVAMPQDFRVTYAWDATTHSLTRRATFEADYLGDGWFADGTRYWQVHNTTPQDDPWMRRSAITGRDLLAFVAQVAPNWRQRGLPYQCGMRAEQAPALSVHVQRVLDDVLELEITWRVPTSGLQEIPSLPGYIASATALVPGVSPQVLARHLGTASGPIRLAGQQIPHFVRDTWPTLQPFATGAVAHLQQTHSILNGACALVLEIRSERRHGVGVVTASPVIEIGALRFDVAELSQRIGAPGEFLRTHAGWLPRAAVATFLGTSNAQPFGAAALAPIPVLPIEVVHHSSERLAGPWSRIEVPFTGLPQGRTPAETTRLHTEFLLTWRLPGGIVSASEDVRAAFAEALVSVVANYPGAKVLVVGARTVLSSLDHVWSSGHVLRLDGIKKDPVLPPGFHGLVAASPRALTTAPDLLRMQWSVVCLLEADALVRSANSDLYHSLRSCRKSLVLGLFNSTDFLQRTSARVALEGLFHADSAATAAVFASVGLRDPSLPPAKLPHPYRMRGMASGQRDAVMSSEIRLPGPSASSGRPIPPRPAAAPELRPAQTPTPRARTVQSDVPSMGHGSATPAQTFIADAKRLVGYRERDATFVPFFCYWPTYDAMDTARRQWYFYWRDQWRAGRYLETDLSYLFVHIYELLNNVGVTDVSDGYRQLWQLWMSYRRHHPKLDNYLADWLTDYLLANRSVPQDLKAHIQALPPGAKVSDPDLLLGYLFDGSPLKLPTVLIEALSDHEISASTASGNGGEAQLHAVLPAVVQRVNSHLLTTTGKGIFETYKPPNGKTVRRDLFRSALFDGPHHPVVTATVVPYADHAPLRAFVTALVTHTEHRLRKHSAYEGLRHSSPLDPAIQALIAEVLGVPVEAPSAGQVRPRAGTQPPPPPPRIALDMGKVEHLQNESAEVLDLLLGDTAPSEFPAALRPARGRDTAVPPPHVAINLEKVDALRRESDEVQQMLSDGAEAVGAGDAGAAQVPPVTAAHSHTPQERVPATPSMHAPGEPNSAAPAMPVPGLPAEWSSFADALTADQREILRTIVARGDVNAVLRAIAERSGTMPQVLIDTLNECALDTLGDYVIVSDSAPPAIAEEHLEMLKVLVAGWMTPIRS